MGALAVDMQMDFWTAPEPEPAQTPVLAAVVSERRVGGGRSLEDLVLDAWEDLAAHTSVDCLVCGAEMSPALGGGGACRRCGAALC